MKVYRGTYLHFDKLKTVNVNIVVLFTLAQFRGETNFLFNIIFVLLNIQ